MQHFQELALIFMQSFCLNIKDRPGIQDNSLPFLHIFGQALFVLLLDKRKIVQKPPVINIRPEPFQLSAVPDKLITDMIADQFAQGRIGRRQPSSLRDSVGDGRELPRKHHIEITEGPAFQNPAVKL